MASVIHRFSPAVWIPILASCGALAFVARDWPARDLAAVPLLFGLHAVIWLVRRK